MSLNDLKHAYYHRMNHPGHTISIAEETTITQPVIIPLQPFLRWTLYVKTHHTGRTRIDLKLSPDGTKTWFGFDGAVFHIDHPDDYKVFEFGYDATHLSLVSDRTNPVTAIVRGIT